MLGSALTIYLACNPRPKPSPLFPRSSHMIRFSKLARQLLAYVYGGIGHLEECKIDVFGAGDQYLGRVVAGLPGNTSVFGVLPPHFGDQQDKTILECMEQMFPSLTVHYYCRTSKSSYLYRSL
ncbi:hypothetical protein PHMEG_00010580 [Phytophthora megakarya]|uniref:Uncharacterized protein n=1 Tax=Phytophthora megakarya TaxID=4795 RepID=A0A225WDP6_9STRA|nr:hypothetical protein PHMEG_00010580 [Phytophthora megakarya]